MYHAPDLPTPQSVTTLEDYRALYADLAGVTFQVDASPWYLYSKEAAASIAPEVLDW